MTKRGEVEATRKGGFGWRSGGKLILAGLVFLSAGSGSVLADDEKAVLGPSDRDAAKADAAFEKGHRALDKRDLRGAEAWYRKAIELNPQEPRYHRQLSLLLLTESRGQQAEREALYATKLDPEDWRSLIALGRVYHMENRMDEEVTTYKKVLQVLPPDEKEMRLKIEDFLKRDELAQKAAAERARKKKEWEERQFKDAY